MIGSDVTHAPDATPALQPSSHPVKGVEPRVYRVFRNGFPTLAPQTPSQASLQRQEVEERQNLRVMLSPNFLQLWGKERHLAPEACLELSPPGPRPSADQLLDSLRDLVVGRIREAPQRPVDQHLLDLEDLVGAHHAG